MTRISLPIRGILLAATVLCLLGGLGASTRADVFNYAGDRRQIKACVLVSNAAANATGKENAVPHVFYILERRSDLKPNGWEFVNPLAPGNITADIYNRWKQRGNGGDPAFINGTPQSVVFGVGAPLTKNIGAYWEVDLDKVSAETLKQYDIILMAYHSANISFSADERAKLQSYVDSGGTLWYEELGGSRITGGEFIVDVVFNGNFAGAAGKSIVAPRHPLVTYPYAMNFLDAQNVGLAAGPNPTPHFATGGGYVAPYILTPVLTWNGQPFLSAGDYGAGHLIISSAGIANGVNNFAGVGLNNAAISGENLSGALPSDMKMAYNIMAWLSSVPTSGVNARRTASTAENVGSQLGPKWATVYPPGGVSGVGSGAVVHKNVVYWVDGSNILHAYNATPGLSLDGSRNPDGGIPDFTFNGAPYDQLWSVNLNLNANVRVSTPTIISLYDTNTASVRDFVLITTDAGDTRAYDAFPLQNNGLLNTTSPLIWSVGPGPRKLSLTITAGGVANTPIPAPSPAYSEGIIFTLVYNATGVTNQALPWRVAPLDPRTGKNMFGGNGGFAPSVINQVNGMSDVIGPLSVGYVRDDATGALDKLIVVATRAPNAPAAPGTPLEPDRIASLWFSTRNEPLTAFDASLMRFRPNGTRSKIPWWAPTNPQAGANTALLPVVHIVHHANAGGPVTGLQTLRFANGDFQVTYEGQAASSNRDMQVTLPNAVGQYDEVYADYTVDWSDDPIGTTAAPAAPTFQELQRIFDNRRFATFNPNASNPANPTRDSYLIAGAAFSRTDDLLFNVNYNPTANAAAATDRVYCLREQYATDFVNQVNGGQSGARVKWMFSPFSGGSYGSATLTPRLVSASGPVNQFKAIGSPASANGTTYVIGSANGGAATVIMALRENPALTFSVDNTVLSQGAVTLQQIDPVRSTNGTPVYITLKEGINFTKDIENGRITIRDCYENSANNADTFNVAMPFYVQVAGTTQQTLITNPVTGFSPLDNLLWYMVIPAAPATLGLAAGENILPTSGLTVVGNALYFGAGHSANNAAHSLVVSIDLTGIKPSAIAPTDWTKRLHARYALLNATGAAVATPIIHPPLATANMVAVGSPAGLLALDNQLTVVADRDRVVEVSYDGDIVWSVDSTRSLAVAGGTLASGSGQVATTKVPLAFPNVARRATLNDFMVADTGNNRILQMDRGGIVNWELRNVRNDMQFLKNGEPLALNHPTDVQTFQEAGTGITLYNRDMSPPVTYTYNGSYFAIHYLIADSGNYRALEVVDAFMPNGLPVTLTGSDGSSVILRGQVIFATRSLSEQNQKLRYRTIQQFVDSNGSPYLISAIDNQRLQPTDAGEAARGLNGSLEGGLGGSLIVIKRDYTANANNQDGSVFAIVNSFLVPLIPNPASINDYRRQSITNPTWFKQINVAGGQVRYLLADDKGCYSLVPASIGGNNEVVVEWMLTSNDYQKLTGRPLRAASIQKLTQADYDPQTNLFYPHYLITNRYSGPVSFNGLSSDDLHGEVIQVRSIVGIRAMRNGGVYQPGDALYTGAPLVPNNQGLIAWMAPSERLDANGRLRRRIGVPGGGTASYLFEQPTFSDRPF